MERLYFVSVFNLPIFTLALFVSLTKMVIQLPLAVREMKRILLHHTVNLGETLTQMKMMTKSGTGIILSSTRTAIAEEARTRATMILVTNMRRTLVPLHAAAAEDKRGQTSTRAKTRTGTIPPRPDAAVDQGIRTRASMIATTGMEAIRSLLWIMTFQEARPH